MLGWALGAYLLLCAVGGVVLAEASLRLHRLPVGDGAVYRAEVQAEFGVSVEDVALHTADGVSLRGWFIGPHAANGRTVIVLHGVTANRVESTGYADMLLSHGFAVLLPDSRRHGESDGRIATYGVLERQDVKAWVDWVRARGPGCVDLLGESMGAEIALQAEAVAPGLCAVAVESPYARFLEISFERLGRESHLGVAAWRTVLRPVVESAIAYTRIRYGVFLPDADPEAGVTQSAVPTLLIAGTADKEIPMHHAEELERACAAHCELWVVAGAGHGGASTVAHEEFEQKVVGWFEEHGERAASPIAAK